MEDRKVKREYNISRIIIVICTFVAFSLIFRNEDSSWWKLTPTFAFAAFLLSFMSEVISKKIIMYGDNIKSMFKKLLYYVAIPIISLVIYWVMLFGAEVLVPDDISLDAGLIIVFFFVIIFIGVILPFVQSIIVLIARKLLSKQSKEMQ